MKKQYTKARIYKAYNRTYKMGFYRALGKAYAEASAFPILITGLYFLASILLPAIYDALVVKVGVTIGSVLFAIAVAYNFAAVLEEKKKAKDVDVIRHNRIN
jgi:uncharacterized membrane protein YesL